MRPASWRDLNIRICRLGGGKNQRAKSWLWRRGTGLGAAWKMALPIRPRPRFLKIFEDEDEDDRFLAATFAGFRL
jgi:hypothetical protein